MTRCPPPRPPRRPRRPAPHRLRAPEALRAVARLRVAGEPQPDLPRARAPPRRGPDRADAAGPRSSKTYALTDAGLDEVRRWLRETAPDRRVRNDARAPDVLPLAARARARREQLERERDYWPAILAELPEIERGAAGADRKERAFRLALEGGIRTLESRLAWLDWAIDEVDRRVGDVAAAPVRRELLGSSHGRLPAHHGSDHRSRAQPRLLRGARLPLLADMDIVRNGELEATNYFFSLGDDENVLELTYNHDGRTYDLGTGVRAHRDRRRRPRRDARGAEGRARHRARASSVPGSEGGSRICFVRDPDDYRIELIERR